MFPKSPARKLILLSLIFFVHSSGSFISYAGSKEDTSENTTELFSDVLTEHIEENRKLRLQNRILAKERDFYSRKVRFYKNLVEGLFESLENIRLEVPYKRFSDTGSGNTHLMTGDINSSLSFSNSYINHGSESSKQENKDRNVQMASVRETNKDIYIKSLEDKLALAKTEIQYLESKVFSNTIPSSSDSFKPEKEQRETAREGISSQKEQSESLNLIVNESKKKDTEKKDYVCNKSFDLEIDKKTNSHAGDEKNYKTVSSETKAKKKDLEIEELKEETAGLCLESESRSHKNDNVIIEEQRLRIEFLEQELAALSKDAKGEEKIADDSVHSEKDHEIAQKHYIRALQEEIEKWHAGDAVQEYIEKIKVLEAQNARLLQLDIVEAASGQTQVWIPFNADAFYHISNLKVQHKISDQPLQEKIQLLKSEYDRTKEFLRPVKKMQLKSLETLEVEDFKNKRSLLTSAIQGLEASEFYTFRKLFEETCQAYEEFSELQEKHEISGLEEYLKIQKVYESVISKISFEDFAEVMQKFEFRKQKLAHIIKQKLDTFADTDETTLRSSCKKVLDLLEFKDRWLSMSRFISKYTEMPNPSNKNYYDAPCVLINQHMSMGRDFDELRIYTKTVYKTNVIEKGLEEECPFKLFDQKIKAPSSENTDINKSLLDDVKDMYMLRYLNQRWQRLQNKFFEHDLKDQIRNCHLKSEVKDIFYKIINKNAFQEYGPLIHASYVKELENELENSLSYGNIKSWKQNDKLDLRESLIDIYTTYKEIINLGIHLNNKNPKYKEFHEEEMY